jgi:homoserine O-succinyltransferase
MIIANHAMQHDRSHTILCKGRMSLETELPATSRGRRPGAVRVGLVNNMPDTALEATEAQFTRLLEAGAGTLTVRLRLYYLPEVPRGAAARQRLAQRYWPASQLEREPADALIVTGMEPGGGGLADEPYWPSFVRLLEWADAHTVSSIWSCLAAHAAAQHLHGIQRRRRPKKLCGVFSHELSGTHPLLEGVSEPLPLPHSRWNDLPAEELRRAGCEILCASPATGADTFIEQRHSLFVCFQGHPEYEDTSLLKEYRRDVGRFLRGEQAQYPTMPTDYFSESAQVRLEAFRARATAAPREGLLGDFPAIEAGGVRNDWQAPAARLYCNWLAFIAARIGTRASEAAPGRRARVSP